MLSNVVVVVVVFVSIALTLLPSRGIPRLDVVSHFLTWCCSSQ